MSKLTLDEAIKHCLEVAEEQSRLYSLCPCPCDGTKNCMSLKNGKDMGCTKCAAEHRQLAEWLMELKEARQYLMEAVDGFKALGKELDEKCELNLDCSKCPLNNGGNCRAWKHTKAVMKLIGGK